MVEGSMHARRSEARGRDGVVSAGHPDAVAAALTLLEAGGNAFDAIVGAAFASFVVEPAQCGLGGYARLAGFDTRARRLVSVDGYLRAPAAAREDMFEIDESRGLKYYETPWTKDLKGEKGHLATGVPGAVAAMWEVHQRWGHLDWARVLEPSIRLAEHGLAVTWNQLLHICEVHRLMRRYPPMLRHFCPGGELPRIGGQFGGATVLDLSELARTLRLIADEGPSGFYEGRVAELIEQEVRQGGGILTAEDLASYRPKVLEETPLDFHGLDCITCFCPTSAEFLNLLGTFDLRSITGAASHHLMAECMLTAFTDTIHWYGDPDFEDTPVAALSSAEFARRRARAIDPQRAMPRPPQPASADDLAVSGHEALPQSVETTPWAPKLGGTTQVAVTDGSGNMAALCISLSDAHGSLVYCPGTGVVLNNGMQNFDPRPGRPNSIKPGKMPIFAAPVLVATRQGEPVFAAAGSGGYRILTGVMHTFVNWAVHGMDLRAAIEAPRIHCQSRETFVDERLPAAVIDELAAMGHDIRLQRDMPGLNAFARVAAVARDPAEGLLTGAAWPPWINDTAAL